MTFLGYVIASDGIKTDPTKVKAVSNFPTPQNLKQTRFFLGVVGYYRWFIPSFLSIAAPWSSLTKKNRLFEWIEEQEGAFQLLKTKLSEFLVLCHYNPKAKTMLQTNASFFSWRFIISQINAKDGLEHPIAIESGRFTGAQLSYTTTKKEFLAIVETFIWARHMSLQVNTIMLTDHHNLKYWMVPRQLTPCQAHWMEVSSGFRFKIVIGLESWQ